MPSCCIGLKLWPKKLITAELSPALFLQFFILLSCHEECPVPLYPCFSALFFCYVSSRSFFSIFIVAFLFLFSIVIAFEKLPRTSEISWLMMVSVASLSFHYPSKASCYMTDNSIFSIRVGVASLVSSINYGFLYLTFMHFT